MSFGASFFSKLGLGEGGMSSLLPQYTSPPGRRADDHDLSELSPRADDGLLSPNSTRELAFMNGANGGNGEDVAVNNSGVVSGTVGGPTSLHVSDKGKGKEKVTAIAYSDQPSTQQRKRDPLSDYQAKKNAYRNREQNLSGPEAWRPPFPAEPYDPDAPNAGPQLSFFESMFMTRPSQPGERTPRSNVDPTFTMIQRRERQMHQELQKLLDAQSEALERDLREVDQDTPTYGDRPASSNSSLSSGRSQGYVIPVRQPGKKRIPKRQARLGITRTMYMLSDLKNEEEAYVATALAERKAALSRLRNLASQKRSIIADIRAIEDDKQRPITSEIRKMEHQHRLVCSNIDRLEERLRQLKEMKAELKRGLDEAISIRDAEVSGHKGALKECDKGIGEFMKHPGISVLELEDLITTDDEYKLLINQHMSGFDFLSLRPERRTTEMAKDWWSGEVQILEKRKTAVDKERAALEEGCKLWEDMLNLIVAHDRRMNSNLRVLTTGSYMQYNPEFSGPGDILRDQFSYCKGTAEQLQTLYDHVEAQGWNLLVAAIGAELNHFTRLRVHFADIIRDMGYGDVDMTPRQTSPSKTSKAEDLVDVHENATEEDHKQEPKHEELSGSVVRRWEDTENPEPSHKNGVPADLLGEHGDDDHREESDNEVPPGLLSEMHHESEDEHHNEVPAEFLSMHKEDAHLDDEVLHDLSRETSANEVPPGLLTEGHRDDTVD